MQFLRHLTLGLDDEDSKVRTEQEVHRVEMTPACADVYAFNTVQAQVLSVCQSLNVRVRDFRPHAAWGDEQE